MKDPEPYLTALEIDVQCAVDTSMSAVLDEAHRSRVNWEIYFFASPKHKKQFDADPLKYCGWVTDPVVKARFLPTPLSPRLDYDRRPFFFIDDSTLAAFEAHPDSLAQPDHRMIQMTPEMR